MVRWLLGRLGQTVVSLWLLASAVFLLSHLGPGAEQFVLPEEDSLGTAAATAAPAWQAQARQALRQRFGSDSPLFYFSREWPENATAPRWHWHGLHNQYHRWLSQLLRGNLGPSLRTGQAAGVRMQQALAYTVPVTGAAILLTIALAVQLAQWLATRRPGFRFARVLLEAGQTLPLFLLSLLLLLLFANPAVLDWFPVYSTGGISSLGQEAARAVLPVLSLMLAAAPALALQLEAALGQQLAQPYAVAARAKGLAEVQVVRRHALRNALLPLLTQFTGLLPALVAGAVVVEVVFARPGMGRLLVDAAATRDYPLLVGAILLTGTARLLALLLADVLYFYSDPRIRWQR